MRQLLLPVFLLLCAWAALFAQEETPDPSAAFLDAYMAVQQGEKLELGGSNKAALQKFRYAVTLLDQIKTRHEGWQPLVVEYRRRRTSETIARLEQKIAIEGPGKPAPASDEPPLPRPDSAPPSLSVSPGSNNTGNDLAALAGREISEKFAQLQRELEESRAQLKTLRQEREEMTRRLDDSLKQLDRARVSEAEIKAKLAQVQNAFTNAVSDGAKGEAERKKMQGELARLQTALEEARIESEAADDLRAEATSRLARVRGQVTNLTAERDQSRTETSATQQKLATAEQEIASVTEERDQAVVELNKARQAQGQVDKLLADNTMLMVKLTDAEKTIQQFRDDAPKKEEQIARLRQDMEEARNQLAAAQTESAEFQSSIKGLQAQLETANQEFAAFKASGASGEQLKQFTSENQVLRGIVLRQLKDQARRNQSKNLVIDELKKLQVQSQVLDEQINFLGQPVMKLSEEERKLFKAPELEILEAEPESSSALEISIAAEKPDQPALATTPTPGDMPPGVSTPQVETSTKPNVPDELLPLAREAKESFERGKFREAEKAYEKILSKAPNNLYTLSNLGVVRYRSNKFKLAEESLKKAIAVAPEDPFSHCTLGIVYYSQNKFDDAVNSLTKSLAINAKNPTAHNYLGITASQKGWQDAAEKELRIAVELDPRYADAWFNLAVVLATKDPPNKEEARRSYRKATDLGAGTDPALEQLVK